MRISDWSSDVCSSDLAAAAGSGPHDRQAAAAPAVSCAAWKGAAAFSIALSGTMGMLRAMIRAPSCLLGLLLALVPVSHAVADCTDPPGPGVPWRRCVFDRPEFQNVTLTCAETRVASFPRADPSRHPFTTAGAFPPPP